MEKYKLLKDLPNAKAGEVFVLVKGHLERIDEDSDGGREILYDRYYVDKYDILNPDKGWFEKIEEKKKFGGRVPKKGDSYYTISWGGTINNLLKEET